MWTPPARRKIHLFDFLPAFEMALRDHLMENEKVCNQDWLELPRYGQEGRTWHYFDLFWEDFIEKGIPIPWLKIASLAMIAWIREKNHRLFPS